MNRHLSDNEIGDWIAGLQGGEAADHLRECAQCAAEVNRTREALVLFRDSGHQSAAYWQAQPGARRSWNWVPLLAAAAALIVVVALRHRTVTPVPVPAPTQEVFLRIPYVVPPAPYERTEVVRMDVPVAALIAAGLKVDRLAGETVSADVVVGQDDRPLAVGFPENKQ